MFDLMLHGLQVAGGKGGGAASGGRGRRGCKWWEKREEGCKWLVGGEGVRGVFMSVTSLFPHILHILPPLAANRRPQMIHFMVLKDSLM